MADYNSNLWAPWRMEYIRSLQEDDRDGCFLCRYWKAPADDEKNHVIWRGPTGFVAMNRFPYTNGHLLVATAAHKGDLQTLDEPELQEHTRHTRDAVRMLREVIAPHGFNVGLNFGRCAGAGLPGHLHTHVVPRWDGDTSYMAVVGNVRVIPEALDTLYRRLVDAAGAIGLGLSRADQQ